MICNLKKPASYFPFANGLYEVAPGLRVFGTDFGNGDHDQHFFQIDQDYFYYLENKEACRSESINKYYLNAEFDERSQYEVCRFIREKLLTENPKYFSMQRIGEYDVFENHLTTEKIFFDQDLKFVKVESKYSKSYVDSFDALSSQVSEDLAVWKMTSGGEFKEWLSAIHLCSPNHWSPGEKVGKSFLSVHMPVANAEKINRPAASLVDAMIKKGPYVRFAWGVATDKRLNHHPAPPPDIADHDWHGRSFNADEPELYLRIERQTLHPFPEVGASLFTIRTYFENVAELKKDETKLKAFEGALLSMKPESLRYKGLVDSIEPILGWIRQSS